MPAEAKQTIVRRKGKDCDLSEEAVTIGIKGEKQGELNVNDNRLKLENQMGKHVGRKDKRLDQEIKETYFNIYFWIVFFVVVFLKRHSLVYQSVWLWSPF